MLQILIAILAGALTIGAPCILPLLPIILGASVGQHSRTRPLAITAGFIVSFGVLGFVLALLAQRSGLSTSTIRTIAIALLGLFGVALLFPSVFERLTNRIGQAAGGMSAKFSNGSGFALGLILGFIWTPCAGPVLGSILTLIATSRDLTRAGVLLAAYAIGAGLPMLAIAYGGQYVTTRVRSIARYANILQRIFGVVIIALAIAMYSGYDLVLQAQLIEYCPYLAPTL